jgi:hypothetical protein
LKAGSAASDGAANTTEPNDAERLAPNIRAAELIEIPSFPITGTSERFPFAEPASDGQKKRPGKIGRRFIENSWSIGGDNATFCACININIVETDRNIRDDAELRSSAQQFVVNFLC